MANDSSVLQGRRAALKVLAGLGITLVGCGAMAGMEGTPDGGADGLAGGDSGATSNPTSCAVIPDETTGPYPDTMGMITNQAYHRRDITEGKAGLPLTLVLTLVDVSRGCAPIANADIEIWHCDAGGVYSEYANGQNAGSTTSTFLRGVQTTDANGQLTFTTIFPGWYSGRAPHIHVQIFANGNTQTPIKTTQIAFPEDVSAAVYATANYASHGQADTSNSRDMVFSDGDEHQLASMAGSATSGYMATLVMGV